MTSADRHILHVDMDAFFAAVEQFDNPELRGKPVLVGGDPRGRGVVSTASYEARPFGCRSAMPMATALRLCPHAIVVPPRMRRYAEISRQVMDILHALTPLVEPLSIDEAFLDITGSTRLFGSPTEIAQTLKQRVYDETGLTASVGVAPNKFIAKLASDLRKPDGLVIVAADEVQEFLDALEIGRLWGAGKTTQARFERLHVRTFADLRRWAESDLQREFGDAGAHFYRLVRGIDHRPVTPDREAKSISHEMTFATDVADRDHLRNVLLEQVEQVARRLRRIQGFARTITLKVRTPDFATVTRRQTLGAPTDETAAFWQAAAALFDDWARQSAAPVRLIGMGVSQLSDGAGRQLSLFEQQRNDRRRRLDSTVDQIRARFGSRALTHGQPEQRRDEH